MVVYVRWYWSDEDLWCYDELDDERWSTRHIEARFQDQTFVAAAALAEANEARDTGGPSAVIAYEHRYGVIPEAPFPAATADNEPSLEPVSAQEFERLWHEGRRARETQDDRHRS